MRVAIHPSPYSFSDRWIKYCKENAIDYIIVNCYDSNIVEQLKYCDALLWHHHHANYKDALFAKQLLYSIQMAGKGVFPDFNTGWHFDDKVGQKYLLEAIGASLVPTYVFYSKNDAFIWIKNTDFPKVFKLRGGAGSGNVRLVNTKKEAFCLARKAFNRGFSLFNRIDNYKERVRKYREGKDTLIGVLKGIGRLIIPTEFGKMRGNEKGYIYFQDFIPNNNSDIRVIVIGDKAYALKRMIRKNDFRASGSGHIVYEKSEIDERCVQMAFAVNKKLKSQSIAYDFVFDKDNYPLIVEISYGYDVEAYDNCPGYWDNDLNWFDGKFNPQAWIIENLINSIKKSNKL